MLDEVALGWVSSLPLAEPLGVEQHRGVLHGV
jgi:hypothetical protein